MSKTRVFDRDRPTAGPVAPGLIARRRSLRYEDLADQRAFLDAFMAGRTAERLGDRRAYIWYREALETDDSVRVAGLIEGAASVPSHERKLLSWKR